MTAPEKVGFLVAGVQKAGTTALDAYLREHPELCLPDKKELHFFDTDRFFAIEPVDYSPYHRAFAPHPPQRLLGEVTPSYLYWPTAGERIARYNAAMKVLLVLRNPITRAYSQWNMARELKREPLAFLDAVKAEPERIRTLQPEIAKRFTYVERGFYARQLRRLSRYIPASQLLIFRSEELQQQRDEVLSRIASFLGIGPFPPVEEKREQVRDYDAPLSETDRRHLVRVFEPEIRELERMLGWDCSAWLA
jgi:hypothetical protein